MVTLQDKINIRIYQYRFLISYIFIGLCSLFVEFSSLYLLSLIGFTFIKAAILGLVFGVIFAYVLNAKINFKVSKAKQKRSIIYFISISSISVLVNLCIQNIVVKSDKLVDYELNRLLVSGLLFSIVYSLHRKFSFRDFKKVGIAIYLSESEDVDIIFSKVMNYIDFVHIDLIDSSYGSESEPRLEMLETIRKRWPRKEIDVHIMSKFPSRYLEYLEDCRVIFHYEIEENLEQILKRAALKGLKSGICLQSQTPTSSILPYVDFIDTVMLLSIKTAGISGQVFDKGVLEKIGEINSMNQRSRFSLCVDGGISDEVVGIIEADKVVSASAILSSGHPISQIFNLKTSKRQGIGV